jgi:hypothetical protein
MLSANEGIPLLDAWGDVTLREAIVLNFEAVQARHLRIL